MRHLSYIIMVMMIMTCVVGCKRVPSNVIDPDDMAELMADMHIAESVVDLNHQYYPTDSDKLILRQSILKAHGVTNEMFDTSLVWYAHNMDTYIDVYDDVIKILEKRNKALGNAIVQSEVNMSGDSIDVWTGSRYVLLNDKFPSKMVEFEMSSDENWEPGDIYTWRVKLIDENVRSLKWYIYATYNDSTVDWLNYSSSSMGWNELIYVSDSTKTLTELKGYFEISTDRSYMPEDSHRRQSNDLWLDSISLVRKRVNPEQYYQRSRVRNYRKL